MDDGQQQLAMDDSQLAVDESQVAMDESPLAVDESQLAMDESSDTSGLDGFLRDYDLAPLRARLSDVTLQSLTLVLFGESRTALLSALQGRGLALSERRRLANALEKAAKQHDPRVAETPEEIARRVAWLDGSTSTAAWPPSSRPFCLFTSAGDSVSSNVLSWLSGRDSDGADGALFDLVVAYYGDEPDPPCLSCADRSFRRRGGKFSNLLHAVRTHLEYFRAFEAIMVADDDLQGLCAADFGRLFAYRRAHDLWVLQPANHPSLGKADIAELRQDASCALRFVNFVEVTCPLFRTDKLLDFLREYQPRRLEKPLAGYGIDRWFCQVLLGAVDANGDVLIRDRCAVVDAVTFINPHDGEKKTGHVHAREIETLQPYEERLEHWRETANARGGVRFWYPHPRVYGGIREEEEAVW